MDHVEIAHDKISRLKKKLNELDSLIEEVTLSDTEWKTIETAVDDAIIHLTLLSYGHIQMESEEEFDWL
ncbi:hypothetical protein QX776_01580 [Alteromonadaceae bacterium BrNp21-10]|nr:hypothetical protein [Alteromonadaceae bacterium BrNp21-10]